MLAKTGTMSRATVPSTSSPVVPYTLSQKRPADPNCSEPVPAGPSHLRTTSTSSRRTLDGLPSQVPQNENPTSGQRIEAVVAEPSLVREPTDDQVEPDHAEESRGDGSCRVLGMVQQREGERGHRQAFPDEAERNEPHVDPIQERSEHRSSGPDD